jgi:hypothetical protein
METVHAHSSVLGAQWKHQDEVFNPASAFEGNRPFEYVENFSRGYDSGRRDGTVAGLLIGSVTGAITALLIALLM